MATQQAPAASEQAPDVDGGGEAGIGWRVARAVRRWTATYWPLLAVAGGGYLLRAVMILWVRPACPIDLQAGAQGLEFASLDPPRCSTVTGDSLFMHVQGQMLAEGHGFGHAFVWLDSGRVVPSAGKPPLFPLWLGFLDLIGLDSIDQQRLASSLLGALAIVLLGLLAWRLAGRRAGLVAAVVAAVSPLMWINDGRLMVESMYVVLIAGLLLAAYQLYAHPRPRTAVALGVLLGLATLVRGETSQLVVLLVIPLAAMIPVLSGKGRFLLVNLVLLAAALTISPWVFRNLTTFSEPTLTQFGTGMALLNGNCDAAYNDEELLGLNNFECFADDESIQWITELVRPEGRDESEIDALMRAKATDYMLDHADRLPAMIAYREGRMWELYRPDQNVEIDWRFEDRGLPESWAGLVAYYLTMPFAIGGLVVLRRRRIPIVPFVSLFVAAAIVAAMTYGLTRYRVAADAVAIVLAAIAVDALLTRLGRPARHPPTGPPLPVPRRLPWPRRRGGADGPGEGGASAPAAVGSGGR